MQDGTLDGWFPLCKRGCVCMPSPPPENQSPDAQRFRACFSGRQKNCLLVEKKETVVCMECADPNQAASAFLASSTA
jgi:hypothetical protein